MSQQQAISLQSFLQQVYPSSDATAKEIASHFEAVHIGKGSFFLREGQRSQEYLFLEQGIMRSYLFDTDGNEVTTAFYTSGNIVMEPASLFLHTPSQENIVAVSDCTTLKLTFTKLNELFHTIPAFRETGRAMLVKSLVTLKMRTLSMINQTAEERYTALLSASPDIFLHIPLKQIASYLGITDTSLSRIRKEMARR